MNEKELLPVGMRRDGSFYTRIEWASTTESDPTFWVPNLIRDDYARNGGTYGANTETSTDVVLSFFGETQTIGRVCLYKNVGLDISVLEELAKTVRLYVSNTDQPRLLRRKEDSIDIADWQLVGQMDTVMCEGWQEMQLNAPVEAKFVRLEMVGNFCTEPFIPWIEMSEVKIYPPTP